MDNNNPLKEENKRILPNRKNRGNKMIELEGNIDQMLYDEQHQWLFLEESSDDDFDPNEKENHFGPGFEEGGGDVRDGDESSYREDEDDDGEGVDDGDNDNDNEVKNSHNHNHDSDSNNDKEKKNRFLLKRKRGELLPSEEICDINQINIEKIDNYEMKKEQMRRKKRQNKLKDNSKAKAQVKLNRHLPTKKVLFTVHSVNLKDN